MPVARLGEGRAAVDPSDRTTKVAAEAVSHPSTTQPPATRSEPSGSGVIVWTARAATSASSEPTEPTDGPGVSRPSGATQPTAATHTVSRRSLAARIARPGFSPDDA